MLPPRIAIAATSDSEVPSAAITAATTPIRASRSANVHSCRRPAPSDRAWSSSPAGSPCTAAAVSATTYGTARIVCPMNTARLVQIRFNEPSGAWGRNRMNRNTPTSTGGSARLTFASARRTLRPRKRPRPIASPIGKPVTGAIRVGTAATWRVKPITLKSVGFPCRIIGTACLSSSQISPISAGPEAQLHAARALLNDRQRPDQPDQQDQEHDRDRGRIRVMRRVVELLEERACESLVLALEVSADDHDRADF